MLSWMDVEPPFGGRAVDLVELFAGKGRITRLAAARGWHVLCHDMTYDKSAKDSGRNNYMDLTKPAGFLSLGFIYIYIYIYSLGFKL